MYRYVIVAQRQNNPYEAAIDALFDGVSTSTSLARAGIRIHCRE